MTYVSIISTDENVSRDNLAKLVVAKKRNNDEATKICSGLAINLADLMANTKSDDTVAFDFSQCREALREIVEAGAPRDATGGQTKPEAKYVNSMMSSANDAVKIAIMLLTSEKTGFYAGYRRNDAGDFVTVETYAAMTEQEKGRHSPEVFWDMSKTFPFELRNGAKSATPKTKTMPERKDMRNAYSLHYGKAKLNDNGTALRVEPKNKTEQPALSSTSSVKDVRAVIDNVGNWLDGDNLMTMDKELLERVAKLGNQCDAAIQRNAEANKVADDAEQAEKELKKAS